MLTPQQINQFKSVLEKQKHELEQTIQTHENEDRASERESVGELSSYDNHPADMATELYEREKDFGLIELRHKQLEDTKHALQKIEAGTYGICEVSGEEIPFERLEAMPTATTCIQHATNKLNMNTRPVEEEVLSPSFHKHDEDRSVEYDAEDSWQDVANYGTSETPSDLERRDSKNYNGMYVNSEENVGYVEDFENFIGTDMYGKNPQVFTTEEHEEYEQMLDDFEERTFKGELSSNDSSSKE
ncbi:yteA family sporulation protein [Bacillus cereus]|uniref:yteA family sporulation protein n=1 Tax=Bacillus sp. RB3 TaxID=3050012 RepID=UPI002541D391|nr:yteA family sporulation protein [Bacillus sp. RB3]MDK3011228.1 yteA family sporulation protein [Bacillus sp. RB3]MDZ4440081.1 yteA family sporulation protein [Bacillus cereus]